MPDEDAEDQVRRQFARHAERYVTSSGYAAVPSSRQPVLQ